MTLNDPWPWIQGHAIIRRRMCEKLYKIETMKYWQKLTHGVGNGASSSEHERPWVTARFATTRSVARPFCDSWASCYNETFSVCVAYVVWFCTEIRVALTEFSVSSHTVSRFSRTTLYGFSIHSSMPLGLLTILIDGDGVDRLQVGSVARRLSGRASDLRSKSRGFEPRPRRCCATTLGKLFTPYCLCHQAV